MAEIQKEKMKQNYKNSQKRYFEESAVYFVTCNTQDKIPFFNEEVFCDLWIEELRICKKLKEFDLFGFCLLPNHFHLPIRPNGKFNLSEIMQSFKRSFSINVNKILGYTKFNESAKLLSRDKSDKAICRLQESGYSDIKDEEVNAKVISHEQIRRDFEMNVLQNLKTKFLQKYKTNHNFQKFKWQRSFHDHIIRNEKDLSEHYNYCVYNYLKHKLKGDWKYTSLNFPELIDKTII